jgi:16S rRNA C1402 N4-methylase RsmH
MADNIIKHFPVMAQNILNRITKSKLASNICVADCNFGFGGHTSLLLRHFPKAKVYFYIKVVRLMIWIQKSLNTFNSTIRINYHNSIYQD